MKPEELLDLTGMVALVTGAGDGIGAGCAEILAAAGAKVVVSNLTLSKAETIVETIKGNGGEAVAFACNVLEDKDLVAAVDFTIKTYGKLNILINNAGGGGGGTENPFNIDRAYVEKIYSMNVFAPWRLCQLATPYMQKAGYGSIVNISSMSSINHSPGIAIYASTKAALNHMSANLAHDFGPMGIRINCVGPGATRTAALAGVMTPEIEARMLAHTPIHRLGEVSDIAQAVLFLASPMAAWISGQTLMVNGGGVQTLD
ncbi:MAG: glucose 1-dehydrogenase [Muribaculaceae bacterium]|nr:glucose 1-dehydrogenase [Muribaculaceae bacterium]